MHTGAHRVTIRISSRNNCLGPDSRNWNHLHTTLPQTTGSKPTAIHQTTGGASSTLSRKELIVSNLL